MILTTFMSYFESYLRPIFDLQKKTEEVMRCNNPHLVLFRNQLFSWSFVLIRPCMIYLLKTSWFKVRARGGHMYLKFTLVLSNHVCHLHSLSLLSLLQDHKDWFACFVLCFVLYAVYKRFTFIIVVFTILTSLHGSSNTSVVAAVILCRPRVYFILGKQYECCWWAYR